MPLHCPYCNHSMVVKDAKPGKYKPKCAKCGERFALTIPADATCEPVVEKLPPSDAGATLAPVAPVPPPAAKTVADVPAMEATMASPSTPKSAEKTATASNEKTQPQGADTTAAFDPSATGAWSGPQNPSQVTTPQGASDVTAVGTYGGATKVPARRADTAHAAGPSNVPATIGGYKIVKELGRGAMGAVYLAKQMSLDRDVALKTIQAQYADNPTFIARFTREAYAAAQLSHHNVVQIYDLGQDGETNYFSMEFVRGQSLDELIKKDGKLDPEVAAGYILQAARGLEYAHNHGMVHRDVKPANMMLSDQGVVKVADLGLVKTPQAAESEAAAEGGEGAVSRSESLSAATADVTLQNMAMGTPAYMAPEQASNAAGVDHRADIYSLGCSLYVLLTGRPPFEGATAMEVITKHRTEAIIRPEAIVKRVPSRLGEICLKMVAKKTEDRYANLGEVIKDLEGLLGIQAGGTFSPKEEHAQTLEESVAKFNGAALAKLRGILPVAFFATCGLIFLGAFFVSWTLASGVVGLAVMTPLAYFLIAGLRERTYFFDRVRQFLFSARIADWLTWIGGGLVFLLALWLLGMLWYWLAFAMLAFVLAAGYHFVVDAGLARQRKESLEKMEAMLKSLRLKGVDENSIRGFVARYSGNDWEEFFEALFGYEGKIAAREQYGRGDSGKSRRKFRSWRDAAIRWMDSRLLAQKELKERQHLQKVEEKNLQAQGVDIVAARKQAQAMADALMDEAADVRQQSLKGGKPLDPKVAAEQKRQRVKHMLAEARRGAYHPKKNRLLGLAFSPLSLALGGKMRFLLGCLIFAGFALWVKQNELLDVGRVTEAAKSTVEAVKTGDVEGATAAAQSSGVDTTKTGKPLAIPLVGPLVSSWWAGLAGLILIVLGFFRGWKMSLFALPAAALLLLGIPGVPFVGEGLGAVIGLGGFFFGRTHVD